ncbi:hypothetical protein FA95DRAFT_1582911 [Auriscalpium vulgare]|uniref:Uncharacterized protein n=1 Tax=Auriscalpium vulgare TaxID=40419 RepID=A0ACB8RT37_9AGAM|nr:hypothetical protein FA95DRAFT_1582911 [Auriscalpium vulgare]
MSMDIDAIPADVLAYSASCNPPRRAKRARTTSLADSADKPKPALPVLAPAVRPRPTSGTAADTEEDVPDIPAPKRRGRKPSTLSRAARESLRRENHSRIEKARRTKINDALATLRALVPSDTRTQPIGDNESDEEDEEEYEDGKKQAKPKSKQEKEFKLEILIKTVTYVQELQERVRMLEEGCSSRRSNLPARSAGSASSMTVRTPTMRSSPQRDNDESEALPRNRLPSISSWLPNAHLSPSLLPTDAHRAPAMQLLTPPTSATLQPMSSPQLPPALSLDLGAPNALAKSFTSLVQRPKPASQSPPWTPEDESAASLLLHIKAASLSPVIAKRGSEVKGDIPRVQTPGSLLGMSI